MKKALRSITALVLTMSLLSGFIPFVPQTDVQSVYASYGDFLSGKETFEASMNVPSFITSDGSADIVYNLGKRVLRVNGASGNGTALVSLESGDSIHVSAVVGFSNPYGIYDISVGDVSVRTDNGAMLIGSNTIVDTIEKDVYYELDLYFKSNGKVDIAVNEELKATVDGNVYDTLTLSAKRGYMYIDSLFAEKTPLIYGIDNKYITTNEGTAVTERAVGGKMNYDVSVKVSTSSTTSSANVYARTGIIDFSNNAIYEFSINVMPVSNVSDVFVATQAHVIMSSRYKKLNVGQWNNFRYFVNTSSREWSLYVNGSVASSGYLAENAANYIVGKSNEIRCVVNKSATETNETAIVYFDDINLRVVDTMDIAEHPGYKPDSDGSFFVSDGVISGSPTYSQLSAAAGSKVETCVFDSSFTPLNISEQNSVIAGSNIVFVDENNVYAYYTVAEETMIKELSTGFVKSNILNCGTFEKVYGFGGKSADDESAHAYGPCNDNNTYYTTGALAYDKGSTYVARASFYPVSGIKRIYFGTKSHTAISADLFENDFKYNRWNSVYLVYSPATGSSALYLNGAFKGFFTLGDSTKTTMDAGAEIRFIAYQKSTDGLDIYMDDFRITRTSGIPAYGTERLLSTDFAYADNSKKVVYTDSSATSSEISESIADRNNCIAVITDSSGVIRNDAVQDDDILTLRYDSGVYDHYIFDVISDGQIVFEGDTVVSKADSGSMLMAARYDDKGTLYDLDISKGADRGIVSLTCAPGDESDLKILLWDGIGNLRPLNKNTGYISNDGAIPSILFVGSEYAKDMAAYFKDVSSAVGIELGVGVLSCDDASYTDQLASVSSEGYYDFSFNGEMRDNSSLDAASQVSDYRWDYIVAAGDYGTEDDSTYKSALADFAAYICEKFPLSSVAVAQPLVNQTGYLHNSGTSVLTEDAHTQLNNTIYTLTKQAVNTAVSKTGRSIVFAPTGMVLESVMSESLFNTTYNKSAHDALYDGAYVGSGIINSDDVGSISMYRDGTNASPAGRFALACGLLRSFLGYPCNAENFSTDVLLNLECDRYGGDGTVFCNFDYLNSAVASKIAYAVNRYYESAYTDGGTNSKNDGFRAKSDAEVVTLESFDVYSSNAMGNGWHINSGSTYFSNVEDDECGGKYLRINKTSTTSKAEAKKYFDPVSGSMRVDMQLCLFDTASDVSFFLYSHNYSDDANDITTLSVRGGNVYTSGSGDKVLATLEAEKWYDISLYLYADTYTINIAIDGKLIGENIPYSMNIRSLSAVRLISAANTAANIGIDNLRVSYINDDEYNSTASDVSSDNDVLMDEDFEAGGAYGHLASGTSVVTGNTSGDITYQYDNNNGYLKATRTQDGGSCSIIIPYSATNNDVCFECKVRIDDNKNSYKLMTVYCNGYGYTFYFNYAGLVSGISLYSYENTGTSSSGKIKTSRITRNRWYNVKVETHTSSGTYDLTFNGTKYSGLKYDTKTNTNNAFRFAITAGNASSYAIDDVKVTEVPITYDGYNPGATGAPEMYDWQNTYMEEPSGIVYNAEDMKLTNYTVTEDAIFHGGKGATVSDWGAGSAKFNFTGDSGYYAVNVGYREAAGMFDSSYELNQNGKRIDWWIGQYDDGQRHVRKSKTWHYVENGDEFELIGVYGEDASAIDYVEFIPSEIPEFTFGDLIDDALSTRPSYWLESSWVGEEEGGYVRYGHVISDSRTDAKSAAIRNFYPTAKSLSLDMTFNASTSTVFDMSIGDRIINALSIRFANGAVSSGGVYVPNAYVGGNNKARITVNRDTDTFSLYINSNVILENVPLTPDMDRLNVLKVETTDRGTGDVSLSSIRMHAGLILDESFRAMKEGSTPGFAGWTVSGATVEKMLSENCDTNSLKITSGGSAHKAISTDCNVVTFETNFIIPVKKDGVKFGISSDSSKIGFYTKGNDIYYDNGDGDTSNDKAVWTNYLHNIWYSASIVANLDSKTATFAINDFSKHENVSINLDAFTGISYESGADAGDLWIDDVKVIPGIYACDVPEPQVAKSDYTVVMEACDLWREGHHFGNDSVVPYDNRTPFLGYLEDGNPEVADWETKFLVEHGINTYATCWYVNANWNQSPIKTPRNSAKLNVGYMKSKYADMLDFAILVTAIGNNYGADPFLEHQVRYWIERYFRSPNYWKVDNKPVIPVFDVGSLVSLDSDMLNKIENLLIEHGFNGAIFIGTHGGATSTANGFDYKYQYHQSNTNIVGHNVINSLLTKQSTDNVKFLASPSQGWGNEAWGRADRKKNVPLDEWQASLEWIKNVYMPGQKSADSNSLTDNTLWLGNWNEYSEGHFLAPSNISGFGYIDAVRKVFTDSPDSHTDVLPSKQFDQLTAHKYR